MRETEQKLGELRVQISACTRCELRAGCGSRGSPWPGQGPAEADLMIVTGHPDPRAVSPLSEMEEGVQLLYTILEELGIVHILSMNRSPLVQNGEVFVASAVRCLVEDTKHVKDIHVKSCMRWLGRQIGLVKPKVIVGLGTIAMSALSGLPLRECKVTRAVGTLLEAPIPHTFMTFTVSPEYVIHRKHQNDGPARSQLKNVLSMAWKAVLTMRGKQSDEDT